MPQQHTGCLKFPFNRIVFRNERTMTPQERLERYYEASVAYPGPKLSLRGEIGANLREAWKAGKRPNLRLIGRALSAR